MRVLTVYAHNDPRSFCHGVLERFTAIDDWAFRYPGIEQVDHVYFYGATAAPPETIQRYLAHAYELGKTFDTTASVTSPTGA